MRTIRVVDMINEMNKRGSNGEHLPFSITWVSCNLKENKGGEKITLEKAVLVGSGNSKSNIKNPQHYENYTRNIRALDGDRIMKIHLLLITRFNGFRITL